MTQAIKGVVFDMDGLLLDTERLYLSAFRTVLNQFDLPHGDDLFLSMVGMNSKNTRRILDDALGAHVDVAAFDAGWRDECARLMHVGIPAKPGVPELIDALGRQGLPHIVATSTNTQRAFTHLAEAGLGPLFPRIIGGDRVANGKPAPDIYLLACAELGLPPEACVAFEDSANGVRAASAAGLRTIQVPDVVPPTDEMRALAHLIADDLLSGARAVGLLD